MKKWLQPGQKNQQSFPALLNIQLLRISQLHALFHIAKERNGWWSVLWARALPFLALNLQCLYTNKCNRLLVFLALIYHFLIFFQLHLRALTCWTDTSFKNISQDIFRQLLNCKILPQNIFQNSRSIWIYHK